jgi:DNA repair exonuclease SbcCD ATPase subunit
LSPGTISGGVRAVVSVALRIARLSLHRPSSRKLLCLDEPFRGLSRQNLRKMNSLIETLARDLGFQIVLVTHDEEISCGKVISI